MSLRARLWLDLALFTALVLAYNPAWTGISVHEWLCVIAVVPLLFHVVINWNQTLQILRRFAERMRSTPKVNLVVDAALFVAFVTVMLSGLLISQSVARSLGVTIAPDSLWTSTHAWSADATMLLLLVHFVLHWRWIVSAAGKLGRTRPQAGRDDPVAAVRLATRRLDAAPPAGRRYATPHVPGDPHHRP
jgi:hypothetical protein